MKMKLLVALILIIGCSKSFLHADTKLWVEISDEEAPEEVSGVLQSDYEGVYVVDEVAVTKRRIDDLGMKSSPILDPTGQRVAYLSGIPPQGITQIRIFDLKSGDIVKYPVADARRSALCYLPNGETIAYTTRDAIVLLNLKTSSKRSFPVPNAECISVSPNGVDIVFWKREGSDQNDADGWILHRLDLSTGQIISAGKKKDGRGVTGQAYWHPSGSNFLIMTFDVDDQNERSNIGYSWFSADLASMGKVNKTPSVIMQQGYPWIGLYTWWDD